MKKILFVLPYIALVVTLGVAGLLIVKYRHHNVGFVSSIPKETADYLYNPYCGWYKIYAYELSDSGEKALMEQVREDALAPEKNRLALVEINLKNYREGEISETGIKELTDILSTWSENDMQLILRFLYDWDGECQKTEPEDIGVVQQHIFQTVNVVNQYAEHVYMMQGVYLGDYGEMHHSRFLEDESYVVSLYQSMAGMLNRDIYMAVRTPAYARSILNRKTVVADNEAFQGSIPGRLALYNDGMMGSDTDLGTYGTKTLYDNDTLPSEKCTRTDELKYQNEHCRYVPNGGEVVTDNALNDFENAIADLATMHVSYLNDSYDEEVLDKWKDYTYQVDGAFYGSDGYDYIGCHLGYRFVLRGASIASPKTFLGSDGSLALRIENVGFSNCYRPLSCTLRLVDDETGEGYLFPVDTDPRRWNSGEVFVVTSPVRLTDLTEGHTYTAYVSLQDLTTKEMIRFGNQTGWSYDCIIGTLSINSAFSFTK